MRRIFHVVAGIFKAPELNEFQREAISIFEDRRDHLGNTLKASKFKGHEWFNEKWHIDYLINCVCKSNLSFEDALKQMSLAKDNPVTADYYQSIPEYRLRANTGLKGDNPPRVRYLGISALRLPGAKGDKDERGPIRFSSKSRPFVPRTLAIVRLTAADDEDRHASTARLATR